MSNAATLPKARTVGSSANRSFRSGTDEIVKDGLAEQVGRQPTLRQDEIVELLLIEARARRCDGSCVTAPLSRPRRNAHAQILLTLTAKYGPDRSDAGRIGSGCSRR